MDNLNNRELWNKLTAWLAEQMRPNMENMSARQIAWPADYWTDGDYRDNYDPAKALSYKAHKYFSDEPRFHYDYTLFMCEPRIKKPYITILPGVVITENKRKLVWINKSMDCRIPYFDQEPAIFQAYEYKVYPLDRFMAWVRTPREKKISDYHEYMKSNPVDTKQERPEHLLSKCA